MDADLLREVALNLKNSGLDIQSFAPLVRLRQVLEQKEWLQGVRPGQQQEEEQNDDDNDIDSLLEKKMESFIVSIEVFCFKHKLPLRQFFDLVYNVQSGKYLHNLTNSFRWRELDIEKEILCQDIDGRLYIHGRLDMYDYKTQTIIDLKTTNAVKWQHAKHLIPRKRDIDHLQCYGSLFQ